ncbi:MAG: transposase [Moorea sp. SIO4G2]|nr:transposase [Moorena sp. SIO4G2]
MKWAELGGRVVEVVAAYTSKLAYDGSGVVKRNSKKYSLATFTSGKRFNADLNGAYNIGARGVFKLVCRNDNEGRSSKRSGRPPRSWVCLCDLWVSGNPKLA